MNGKRRRGLHARGPLAVAVGLLLVALTAACGSRAEDGAAPTGQATSPVTDKVAAKGCDGRTLDVTLADAREQGASIIVGTIALTGESDRTDGVYDEVVIREVRTVAGPEIPAGTKAWISGRRAAEGAVPAPLSGALWGPDGRMFGILWPQDAISGTIGPSLRLAAVVGDEVVFAKADCWNTAGLRSRPYDGRLEEIPGSDSYERAVPAGFQAVTVTDVEDLAAR